jgi:cystathionine gamma-synthase
MPDPGKPATLAVHAGTRFESKARPLIEGIHVSTVSYFDKSADLDRSLDGEDFVYARITHQNGVLLEAAMAALEGAEGCVAYATGMAAMRALLDAQALKTGDAVVIPADCYGVTRALFKAHCAERGAELHSLDLADPHAPERVSALEPHFVLAESITNPLLAVPDLPALANACRAAGATFAVDATFASPAFQRPLEMGADYALHSTTKWINGHSDAMGGVVSAKADRVRALRASRTVDGAILGPFEAYLTLRGLRTLLVRMRAHSENALKISQRLAESPLMERVIYPGLATHPHHAVARRVLDGGFGGMMAFEIRGAGRAEVFRFLESLRLAKPAPSLGDVATMVMHAASAASRRMSPEERAAAGIKENLVRVSVGLEDPDDVAQDLLAAASKAMS